MFALSRRWTRQLSYLGLLIFLIGLLVTVVDLLYKNILPDKLHISISSYSQPDQIITGVEFQDCSIFNSDCQLKKSGNWVKNLVDLKLSQSWTSKTFIYSNVIKLEDVNPDQKKVIMDFAVSNPMNDSLINGNEKLLIPSYVITDYRADMPSKTDEIPTREILKSKYGWQEEQYGLWVKYGDYNQMKAVSEIDVLFGADCVDPRPNWKLLSNPLLIGDTINNDITQVHLTFRRGRARPIKKPDLKITKEYKFKILQVADLHFSTGYGECRDPYPIESANNCKADPRTLKFINHVLDIEKPDMVVLTGDQIFGETSLDSKSSLFKALNPFIKRNIPYAITLGNHDDEGSIKSRKEIMMLASSLPYSLSELGPETVDGFGNYALSLQGYNSANSAATLWFLDSHKYSPSPKTNPGYDWIKESQLNFIESKYQELEPLRKHYTHIHLSMAFFHIPLPEYRNVKNQILIGELKEAVTAPNYNTGARDILHKLGVSVVSVGHDHCNDYCLMDTNKDYEADKMWLCYGGAAGEGGYSGYGGTPRRVRVFEIDTQRNDIRSWKRVETDVQKLDDSQVLVSGGSVTAGQMK
ncbi:hypothetical protein PACTADRAFT_75226 [Pachysolen tannophilus NRRL Y-2460]|uniref:Calcineurin-like phosphoesterase domain-containing protein n=1 Tax=Pachysolen tannophilus NRRL Y-2460 TaxID=669874 RepID=A0A1E4TWE0_PACTA|nr:hypothetical protein PACTADRAFT_75226 [Pachysolen tannophilus NRRL Y-2460]